MLDLKIKSGYYDGIIAFAIVNYDIKDKRLLLMKFAELSKMVDITNLTSCWK